MLIYILIVNINKNNVNLPRTKTILCPEKGTSSSTSESDVTMFFSVSSLSLSSVDSCGKILPIGGNGSCCFIFIGSISVGNVVRLLPASDLIGPSVFGMGGSGVFFTSKNVSHLMFLSCLAREMQSARNVNGSSGWLYNRPVSIPC